MEHTLFRVSRNENILPGFKDIRASRHRKFSLNDVRVMAAEAFRLQNRGHFRQEVYRSSRRCPHEQPHYHRIEQSGRS